MKRGHADWPVRLVPAAELERVIIDQLRLLMRTPEIIIQTWRAARNQHNGISEGEVRNALLRFDELWNELFPAEQARVVELLVMRVDLGTEKLEIALDIQGLTSLTGQLSPQVFFGQAAA